MKEPDTVWEDIPTDGIQDPRWEGFENRYRDYILKCIEDKDPNCGCAANDILMRFRTFFNNVLGKYKYRPEVERFRTFIRRFIDATIDHVKSKKGTMADYPKEFKGAQRSGDDDLNYSFDELIKQISIDVTLDSGELTEDQRYIFKAMVVEKCPLLDKYDQAYVEEAVRAAWKVCELIHNDIMNSCGPDFYGAA